MRSSRCIFNTAAALHRVFLAPIEQSQLQIPRNAPSIAFLPLRLLQRRAYHVKSKAVKEERAPRDDEITARFITFVDESGKIHEPRSTKLVLAEVESLNHTLNLRAGNVKPKKYKTLIQVNDGEPGVPPICKIMDLGQMYQAAKKKKKQQFSSRSNAVTKTIELNWAVNAGDLEHRLERMKEFLGKGYKVEVVLASKSKRKGRQATREEAEEVLRRVRGVVGETEGAKESRASEGNVLGTMTIHFEGTAPKEEKASKKTEKSGKTKKTEEVAEIEQSVEAVV